MARNSKIACSRIFVNQHKFSALKTPQQNRVAERKNITIQDIIRVMLNTKNMTHSWWAEVANSAACIINGIYLRPMMEKIACEIWKGKKPKLSYLYVFGKNAKY